MAKDERQRIKDRVAEDEDLMSVLNFMERSDCELLRDPEVFEDTPYWILKKRISDYMFIDARREYENFFLNSRIKKYIPVHNFKEYKILMAPNQIADHFLMTVLIEKEDTQFSTVNRFLFDTLSKKTEFTSLSSIEHYGDVQMADSIEYIFANIDFARVSQLIESMNKHMHKFGFVAINAYMRILDGFAKYHWKYCMESPQFKKSLQLIENFTKELIFNNKRAFILPSTVDFINRFYKINWKFKKQLIPNCVELYKTASDICVEVYEEEDKFNSLSFNNYSDRVLIDLFMLLSFGNKARKEKLENPVIRKILTELDTRRFDRFGLETLTRFLENCSKSKIPFSSIIGEKIISNKKLFQRKSGKIIFLLIDTFGNSKIPLTQLNFEILRTFSILINNGLVKYENFKNVMVLTRCLQYLCDNRLRRHHLLTLSRCIPIFLKEIEMKIKYQKTNVPIESIIDLSTIFSKHLDIPNFLFAQIVERIDDVKIDQENRLRIRRLLEILKVRLKNQYTYNTFIGGNAHIEYNYKWTPDTIQLIRVLLYKFRETNLVSYHILASNILEDQQLLNKILVTKKDRKVHIGFLMKQLGAYIHSQQEIDIFLFKPLIKIISHNLDILDEEEVLNLYQSMVGHLEKGQEQYSNMNSIIPLFSYLCQGVKQLAQHKLERNLLMKRNFLYKKCTIFNGEVIMPLVLRRKNLLVDEVEYDSSIRQTFNANIFSSELKNFEYIPEIIDHLDYTLTPETIETIKMILERTCRRWKGLQLSTNLLILNKRGLLTYEMVRKVLPNLFTLVDYYIENSNYNLSHQLSKEDTLELTHILISVLNKDRERSQQENLMILSIFASEVLDDMRKEDIIDLLGLLSNRYHNYSLGFIQLLKDYKFTKIDTEQQGLLIYSKLPYFCENMFLSRKFSSLRRPNDYPEDIILLLKNRQVYSRNYFELIFEFFEKGKIDLFSLLDYLNLCIPGNTKGYYIDLLINRVMNSREEMSRAQKENILLVFKRLEFKRKGFRDLNYRKDLAKLLEDFAHDILLHQDYGYTSVMLPNEDGELVKITFYESLSLDLNTDQRFKERYDFMLNPTIDMQKVTNHSINFENTVEDDSLLLSEFLHTENKARSKIDLIKDCEDKKTFEALKTDYYKYLRRFLVYQFYKPMVKEIEDSNEVLFTKFWESQEVFFTQKGLKDSYTNFIVDITMVLYEMDLSFETSYKCPTTQIITDIYIESKKIAFVFLASGEACYDLNKRDYRAVETLNSLKDFYYEKMGVTICFIDYEFWQTDYSNFSSKQRFFQNVMDEAG